MTVPRAVADLLRGVPEVGAREQAFPFLTVDDAGYPHTALLSRMELEPGPGDGDLRAAVRSRRTRAHLERDGHAALVAVDGTTAHYVKLRLVRSLPVHDLLACVFAVAEHRADSMGIPLQPLTYPVTEDVARAERWDTTVSALRALHALRRPPVPRGDS